MQVQSQELSTNTGPVAPMSELTGARAQVVQGMRQLSTAVESLAGRLSAQSVAINLAPLKKPPGAASGWQDAPSSTTLLTLASTASIQMGFAKSVSAVWPIPEPFVLHDKATSVIAASPLPTISYQLVVPPPDSPGWSGSVGGGGPDWGAGGWNDVSMLQPDVYDVEQCGVTEMLVSRSKELKTRRAYLLLYVPLSSTPAPTNTPAHVVTPIQNGGEKRGGNVVVGPGPLDEDGLKVLLQAIKAAGTGCVELSPTLTSPERARVHALAESMSLMHQSVGQGAARYIRVFVFVPDSAHVAAVGAAQGGDVSQDVGAAGMEQGGEEWEAGEGEGCGVVPFGLLRLRQADGRPLNTRPGSVSDVEMVLLPYNFPKLLALVHRHLTDMAPITSNAAPKLSQAAAAAAHVGLRTEMMEYYKSVPSCYLKPLRAVLRKASSSASIQVLTPQRACV